MNDGASSHCLAALLIAAFLLIGPQTLYASIVKAIQRCLCGVGGRPRPRFGGDRGAAASSASVTAITSSAVISKKASDGMSDIRPHAQRKASNSASVSLSIQVRPSGASGGPYVL